MYIYLLLIKEIEEENMKIKKFTMHFFKILKLLILILILISCSNPVISDLNPDEDINNNLNLKVSGQYPEWNLYGTYTVNDIVQYQNELYICIQAHTVYGDPNWCPLYTPALWGNYSDDDPEGILKGEDAVPTNLIVELEIPGYPNIDEFIRYITFENWFNSTINIPILFIKQDDSHWRGTATNLGKKRLAELNKTGNRWYWDSMYLRNIWGDHRLAIKHIKVRVNYNLPGSFQDQIVLAEGAVWEYLEAGEDRDRRTTPSK